jgi:hypothetical protein
MKTKTCCLLMLVLNVVACSVPKSLGQSKAPPSGEYTYSGFSTDGTKIVEGRLSITSIDNQKFKGDWDLKQVGKSERIGPQVGNGTLIGSLILGKININLNPNTADSNVMLTGAIEAGSLHGTWSYIGYQGVINRGTFEAASR